MLSILRTYHIISFVLVLLAAFAVGVYFRTVSVSGLVKNSEMKNAVILTRSYENNIWTKYRETLKALAAVNKNEWVSNPDFVNFFAESRIFFTDVPLVKFSVYNTRKEPIFAMNRVKIDENNGIIEKLSPFYYLFHSDEDKNFAQAVQGKVTSRIIPAASLQSDKLIGAKGAIQGSYVQIFIPLPASGGAAEAVAEVYYDISPSWNYLFRFQLIGTAAIIIFMTVLYTVLMIVSRRAEKIIDKQHEANLELTNAKARAEAESQEKSKFLANVSHELRTPLNAIIGFSQIMKDEVNGPLGNEVYQDYIRDIHNSGSHLLSLINDILDYSKAEANKLEMDAVDIDVNKIIRSCTRFVMPRAEEAKVQLVEKVPKEHIILKADSKRLRQVLLNLLSNAVKFTPENGTVTLMARVNTDGSLTIEVSDTGIGIAQQDISKAMATFGQVDSKLSRRYEGTGLGLPLTKKLTELMGGGFEIKSEVGLGTTVSIHFSKEKLSSLPAVEG